MTEERFLIDANTFIRPYRQYYAFDLVPSYWKEISDKSTSGRLILLDMVKAEIDKGDDELTEWLDEQSGFIICNHVSPEIISQYQNVMQYVQTCGLYKEQALASWAPEDVADPWLIAAVAVLSCVTSRK
ncbi:MAG: DUF4411 family protein [Clostridiales bacterium]|nr:DUF4411 family protein [Clostridiales bacterium]